MENIQRPTLTAYRMSVRVGAMSMAVLLLLLLHTGNADVSSEQARAKALRIVKASGAREPVTYRGMVMVEWGVPLRLKGPPDDPTRETESDPKGTCYSFQFAEGSDNEDMSVDISVMTGRVHEIYCSRYTTVKKGRIVLTPDQCRKRALSWMKTIGASLATDMCLYASRTIRSEQSFEWRRGIKGRAGVVLLPPYISVNVNRESGGIGSYHRLDYELHLRSFEPRISKEVAIEKATQAIRENINNPYGKLYRGGEPGKLTDTFLTIWATPAYRDRPAKQTLTWEIRFEGREKGRGRDGAIWHAAHWSAVVSAINGLVAFADATGAYIERAAPRQPQAKAMG